MSLIVEDGTGVENAASYATVAEVTAYWAARTHDPLATAWAALTTAIQEGSLREATAYLDGVYGPYYRGIRKGYVQGLLWPRSGALDEAGFPLPNLPPQLKTAAAELAARAATDRLAPDAARGDAIKRVKKKVGPLETETEYLDSASTETRYSVIDGIMSAITMGQAGKPGGASWNWA